MSCALRPWKEVNTYPCERKFQAIGEGGDEFVADIVKLVEGAVGRKVDPEKVSQRESRKAKYVSANVILTLESGEEVIAIYSALKSDPRVKWYL